MGLRDFENIFTKKSILLSKFPEDTEIIRIFVNNDYTDTIVSVIIKSKKFPIVSEDALIQKEYLTYTNWEIIK